MEVYSAAPGGDFDLKIFNHASLNPLNAWLKERKIGSVCLHYTPNLFGWKNLWPLHLVQDCKAAGIEVILFCHELFLPYYPNLFGKTIQRTWNNWKDGKLLKAVDTVFVTTEERVSFLKTKIGVKAYFLPIGNSIPVVKTSPGEIEKRKNKIDFSAGWLGCCFGLYHADKNYETALSSLKNFQNITLVILGGTRNPYAEKLKNQVEAEGLSRRVYFLFNLSKQEVSQWFQACDFFLLTDIRGPSARKSSWIAALAHGLPVLAEQGTSQLTKQINEILTNPDLIKKKRQESIALFQKEYSWDRIKAEFKKVLMK